MLLDTDFLISSLRKRPEALEKLEHLRENRTILFITHVNLWELYAGALNHLKKLKIFPC